MLALCGPQDLSGQLGLLDPLKHICPQARRRHNGLVLRPALQQAQGLSMSGPDGLNGFFLHVWNIHIAQRVVNGYVDIFDSSDRTVPAFHSPLCE